MHMRSNLGFLDVSPYVLQDFKVDHLLLCQSGRSLKDFFGAYIRRRCELKEMKDEASAAESHYIKLFLNRFEKCEKRKEMRN